LGLVVAGAGVAYASNAPRWVLGGDNGEFASLFAAGGVAHPPGFPVMVLWLRLCHALMPAGLGAPVYGAALATAVVATLSVWALQRACLAWGASSGSAAVVSAVYAVSPVAWELGSHAEVFAMNAMFAGVVLALCAPRRDGEAGRGAAWMAVLGGVAGLAIDAHQTIVLLAPVGLVAAVLAIREAPRRARVGLAAAGVGALGLGVVLPYVYVYGRARAGDFRHQPLWIDDATLVALFAHFRRAAYGTLSLAPESLAASRDPVASMLRFAKGSLLHLLGLPLLVVVAAVHATRARPGGARPAGAGGGPLVALVASYLLVGPAFAAAMNLTTQGAGLRVAERFELLPDLVMSVLAALSLDRLAPGVFSRARVATPLTLGAFTAAALVAIAAVREDRRPDVATYVDVVLDAAPPGAIVVAGGDACWGAFMYARYAEHRRPDVTVFNAGLLRYAWYRRDAEDATGVVLETPEGKPIGPKTTLARLLHTGRPLFYTEWPDAKLAATPHDSYGPLMRVVRDGAPRPPIDEVLAANTALFDRAGLPAPPDDATAWGRPLFEEYARAWVELGRGLALAGRATEANACFERALGLAPWALTMEGAAAR
jgi:hypothetical protein